MRTHPRRWSFPAAGLLMGVMIGSCVTAVPPAAPPPADRWASCDEQLQAIADCFLKVVYAVQAEPKRGESLARFLGEAAAQVSSGPVHEACARLHLTPQTPLLLLFDGSEVRASKTADSEDLLEGGVSVLDFTYRFSSSGCPGTAEARISMTLGGSAE